MTYFGFLTVFLGLPIVIFGWIYLNDNRVGRSLPETIKGWPFRMAVLLHVLIAFSYTTPWDNYLVATKVWYYDPARVTGITLGFVPIEEYTFFIVQTLFTCLWLHFIALRITMPKKAFIPSTKYRWVLVGIIAILWIISISWLILKWKPGTYMGLILVWALPPIGLQFLFGGDILKYHWRLVIASFLPPTLYLSLADSFAIFQGIWEISADQSMEIFLGGVLPIEEFIFFLVTNLLVSFGVILFMSSDSYDRMISLSKRFSSITAADWRKLNRG